MNTFFSSPKVQSVSVLTLILLFTFVLFFPCLRFPILSWDDNVHLTENPFVRGLSLPYLQKIFTQKVNRTYHPLTTLSYAVEYYFAGYNPFLYHLDNLLLHLGVVFFAFLFFKQLGFSLWVAGIATLFFAIHPTRVESVAWITERKDVLYGFFYMAGLNAYLYYVKTKDGRFYALTVLLALLSVLSKAMALSFPLVLFLCDGYQGRPITRKGIVEKLPIFLLMAVVAGVTYAEYVRFPIRDYYQAALIWVWTLTFYIKKFFSPGILLPIYDTPRPVAILHPAYFSSFIIFFIVALFLFYGRRIKWIFFSLGFYFLSIFFLLRFDYGYDAQPVADRWMYLPALGLCLLVAVSAEALSKQGRQQKKIVKACCLTVLAGLIAYMALRTHMQCRIWKDDHSLWSYQMEHNINTPIALNNFALTFGLGADESFYAKDFNQLKTRVEKNPDVLRQLEARSAFGNIHDIDDIKNLAERRFVVLKKALSVAPLISEPLVNLGEMYVKLGLPDIGISYYKLSFKVKKDYMKAYYDLAFVYAELGRDEESVRKYWEALRLKRMDPFECGIVAKDYNEIIDRRKRKGEDASVFLEARETLYVYLRNQMLEKSGEIVDRQQLGRIYDELEDFEAAVSVYKDNLEANPKDVATLLSLGNVYLKQKKYPQAIVFYQRILAAQPQNKEAYLNLGVCHNKLKEYTKAIEYYQKALELDPNNALAYFDLGFAHENLDKNQEAIAFYQKAIKLKKDYYKAYYNIGNIWMKLKNAVKAEEAYRQAVSLKPQHIDSLMNLSIALFYQKKFTEADVFCKKAQALGFKPPEQYVQALKYYKDNPAAANTQGR